MVISTGLSQHLLACRAGRPQWSHRIVRIQRWLRFQCPFSRAQVGLVLKDLGDFNVMSQHSMYCPLRSGLQASQSAALMPRRNLSITAEAYALSSASTFSCTYELDCPEGNTCGWKSVKFLKRPATPCGGPYVQVAHCWLTGPFVSITPI